MPFISINSIGCGSFYGPTANKKKNGSVRSGHNNKKKSGKITVRKTMSAQSYMLRLSNAKNPAQVANIIRCARLEANSVKSMTNSESAAANAKKIANAVAKKGILKISRLKKEETLRRKKELEQSVGNTKKAMLTAKKLRKKIRARKSEERADAANAITPYKKNEEEYPNSSPSAVHAADIGAVIDVCVTADAAADIPACSESSVDIAL